MNTIELIQAIKQDPKSHGKFCGVYASDTLPKQIEHYPCGLIVNTDPQTEKGSHWVAMYFPNELKAEFLDSYGNSPEFYQDSFKTFLDSHSRKWTYNHRCLQSLMSSMCGQFCVYFITNRNRGKSLSKIVNSFSNKLNVNDHRVSEFVRRLLRFSNLRNKKKSQTAITRVQNNNNNNHNKKIH